MAMLRIAAICVGFIAAFALITFAGQAKLQLNPVFGEHMVLQRDMPIEIFGTGMQGKTVTVEIAGQKASGVVSASGEWSIKLQPITAGASRSMSVTSGKDAILFQDVSTGDVWFCSGQSNM